MKRWIEGAAVTATGLAFGLGADARGELAHARTAEPVAFWFAVAVTILALVLTCLLLWADRVQLDDEVSLPKAIARRARAWQSVGLDAGRRAS